MNKSISVKLRCGFVHDMIKLKSVNRVENRRVNTLRVKKKKKNSHPAHFIAIAGIFNHDSDQSESSFSLNIKFQSTGSLFPA